MAAPTDYESAAQRHYAGATLLHAQQQSANADHLAGIAAECTIKAILEQHCGAQFRRGRLTHTALGKKTFGHFAELWGELALAIQGRVGPNFAAFVSGPNPFADWDVADRYSDGAHISTTVAAEHIDAARRILATHQQAKLDGRLT